MAISWVLMLVFALNTGVLASDVFTGYNCQSPEDTKFISHQHCHKTLSTTKAKQFKILQKKTRTEISGYICEGYKTVEVSFCGAYSHTKQTGESTFNVPIIFSQLECLAMVSSKAYTTDAMSYPLIMNNINSIKFYTHGSVTYTGTNIHCTGENLRLQNGEINEKMLRQVHILVEIRRYQLMEVDGYVVDPISQVKLGQTQNGNAQSGPKTFIWSNVRKHCQLMQIMDLTMESNNDKDWISHLHKIKITSVDSFHHPGCNMKIIKTNIKNLYLSDHGQQNGNIEDVDVKNVDLSAELNTRFGFIYEKMNQQLTRDYLQVDPICHRFQSSNTEEAQRTDNNRFIKSLGDISISFECREVQVAHIPSDRCHSMLPVTDLNGIKWFLNPDNRMLRTQAVEVPCNIATLPVYRSTNNLMITFNPGRQVINPESPLPSTPNNTSEDGGLYSHDLVKQWLDNSYLQHWSKYSYSTLVSVFCQEEKCKTGHSNIQSMRDYIGGAITNLSKTAAENFIWGVNLEKVGGICSIIVVFLLIIYTGYAIVAWAIRFALFNHEELKMGAKICRATFPAFFLITKDQTKTNNIEV